jgi:hypothetical protein
MLQCMDAALWAAETRAANTDADLKAHWNKQQTAGSTAVW